MPTSCPSKQARARLRPYGELRKASPGADASFAQAPAEALQPPPVPSVAELLAACGVVKRRTSQPDGLRPRQLSLLPVDGLECLCSIFVGADLRGGYPES